MSRALRLVLLFLLALILLGFVAKVAGAQDRGHRRGERGPGVSQRNPRSDDRSRAERRHPQARPRREAERDNRYHWRGYGHGDRSRVDRFPRHYRGDPYFRDRSYRRAPFRYHGRYPYYRGSQMLFHYYWPFAFAPEYGCRAYWVPTARVLRYDPYTGDEYYDYTRWRYVELCFD